MKKPPPIRVLLLLFALAQWAGSATVAVFTDKAAFLASLPPVMDMQGFEGLPPETPVADGAVFGGTEFNAGVSNLDMLATARFRQTTVGGEVSLGMDTADNAFLSGDQLHFAFDAPAFAIGLYVIGSPGDIRTNDFTLSIAGFEVSNGQESEGILPDGGEAYFLGIAVTDLDPAATFAEAVLTSHDMEELGLYAFNIDDMLIFSTGNMADVAVYRTGPASAEFDSKATITTIIENAGPGPALDIEVAHDTPPGLIFLYNQGDTIQPFPLAIGEVSAGNPFIVHSTYSVPLNYAGPVVATGAVYASTPVHDPNPGQESAFWAMVVDPAGDRDGDGFNNLGETWADTDPYNPTSLLELTGIGLTNDTAWLEWTGGVLATQVLEHTPALVPADWQPMFTNQPPTAISNNLNLINATNQTHFYRIRIER